MGTIPALASVTQALDMVRAGLRFLAAADATRLTAAERAAFLRGLEHADAAATAARTCMLAGVHRRAGLHRRRGLQPSLMGGPPDPGHPRRRRGPHRLAQRSAAPPAVHTALAAEAISVSYAREICRWTGTLPADARAATDEILLAAAASGLELEDLAALAAEMYEKSRQDKPDDGDEDGDGDGNGLGAAFDDRTVKVATTIGGAGVIRGT